MNNQLEDEKLYYIYRHIRTDKNEPFYVGKGTVNFNKTTEKSVYARAYAGHDKTYSARSQLWENIAKKSKYDVEIIFHSYSLDEILRKEIEFISLYGRIDLGTGTLANLTCGGDGDIGRPRSEETKARMREAFKNRPYAAAKKVFAYKLTGEFFETFESMFAAAEAIGSQSSNIGLSIKRSKSSGKYYHVKGLVFFEAYQGEKINKIKINNRILIDQYDEDMNLIQEFLSSTHAEAILGINRKEILKASREGSILNGFYFKSY